MEYIGEIFDILIDSSDDDDEDVPNPNFMVEDNGENKIIKLQHSLCVVSFAHWHYIYDITLLF